MVRFKEDLIEVDFGEINLEESFEVEYDDETSEIKFDDEPFEVEYEEESLELEFGDEIFEVEYEEETH